MSAATAGRSARSSAPKSNVPTPLPEAHFDAIPFDAAAARECGRLHAAVAQRGGKPRRRALDLAVAATANVHGVPLLTYNAKDFEIIADMVDVRAPSP